MTRSKKLSTSCWDPAPQAKGLGRSVAHLCLALGRWVVQPITFSPVVTCDSSGTAEPAAAGRSPGAAEAVMTAPALPGMTAWGQCADWVCDTGGGPTSPGA